MARLKLTDNDPGHDPDVHFPHYPLLHLRQVLSRLKIMSGVIHDGRLYLKQVGIVSSKSDANEIQM